MPVQKGADARQAPSSATTPAMAPGLLSPAEATKVLSQMTFDNLPLRESLFASLFESKADTEKRLEGGGNKLLLAAFRALDGVDFPGIPVEEILKRCGTAKKGRGSSDKSDEQLEALMAGCTSDMAFFKCTNVNEPVAKFCWTAVITQRIATSCVHIFEKNADASYVLPAKKFYQDRATKPEDKIEPRQVECLRKVLELHTLRPKTERSRQVKCSKCHRLADSKKNELEVEGCASCVRVYHKECMTPVELATDSSKWSCFRCAEAGHGALRRMVELTEKLAGIMATKERNAAKKQRKGSASGSALRQNSRQLSSATETANTDDDALEQAKKRLKSETHMQAKDRQALEKSIEGPAREYAKLFPSRESFEVFNMASSVAEFLSLYGDICELEEVLDTNALLQATKWPLDFSQDLMALYSQLLLCCLLEQHNHEGLSKARARKWMRVLSNNTWPEVLRRYIGQRPVERQHHGDKERLRRAKEMLATNAWFELPVDLQLFLLHVLCHDIAQGQALKSDMCAPPREYRTDCLGVDRYGRRYWTLRGSPGLIAVEDDKGNHAGVLTSAKDLDYLIGHLMRKGPGEGALLATLVRMRDSLLDSFQKSPDPSTTLVVDTLEKRPRAGAGTGGALKEEDSGGDGGSDHDDDDMEVDAERDDQKESLVAAVIAAGGSDQDKARALTAEAIDEAKMKLENVLHDVAKVNRQVGEVGLGYKKTLEASTSTLSHDMCRFMLELEAGMSMAGEGVPPYGTNEDVRIFMDEDAEALPELVEDPAKTDAELEENRVLGLKALKPFIVDPENPHGDAIDLDDSDDPNPPRKSVPVDQDDDYDCSDAEHTFLREKRMRKPARLWRSGRERAVWLRGVLNALASTDSAAGSTATFSAYVLGDRITLLADRCKGIEKELARQEEKELIKKKQLEEDKLEAELKAQDRPMMIVTEYVQDEKAGDNGENKDDKEVETKADKLDDEAGKVDNDDTNDTNANEEDELAVKLLQIGRDPRALEEATQADVAECKWEYLCHLCRRPGALYCCEHEEGCSVSAHIKCTGVHESSLANGKWVCLNHDDTRRRRKKRALAGEWALGDEAEVSDSESTDSD